MNIVIVGASSEIASQMARQLAARGDRLVLLGRSAGNLNDQAADLKVRGAALAECMAMDLAAADPVEALNRSRDILGSIDRLVVAYGALGEQSLAMQDPQHARDLLQVNFTSAAGWLLAGLQTVSASGSIAALSSVAGDRGRQSNFVYGAAKGGLSIFLQGMAHHCAKSGPHIVVVKLGFVDTPMTQAFRKGFLWAKPDAVAKRIIRAMDDGTNGTLYVPWFWRGIMAIIRAVPEMIFHKTKL
jgi:short-subunit dehydrogenase